jgi:hypothetical protein
MPKHKPTDGKGTDSTRLLTLLLIVLVVTKAAVLSAAWFGITHREPDRASYLGNYHHYREDPHVTRRGHTEF